MVEILERTVEGLSEKVTFEQRPEGAKAVIHVTVQEHFNQRGQQGQRPWGGSIPGVCKQNIRENRVLGVGKCESNQRWSERWWYGVAALTGP